MPVLDELPVENAPEGIKNIYAAIEASLSVKLVNLVYRHLATVPGALEWAWGTVGPVFENGVFAERSRGLGTLGDIPATTIVSLSQAGLSNIQSQRAIETVDAYNLANPMNALSLRVLAIALETGRPAVCRPPVPVDTPELPALLPMTPLEGVAPEMRDTLFHLARLTTGQNSGLVPSLFRHFAAWPDLLTGLADWLEPLAEDGVIERQVAAISKKSDEIARDIFAQLAPPGDGAVLPDAATRDALLRTIKIFPPTICRMIVIGGLLHTALRL